MAAKINVRNFKGTRDFLPEQMVKRQFVLKKIMTVFERYGFEPLETPALELMEILGGKYGEEGDKLLYSFHDRGGRHVGLRYDLTVPLSRVAAQYPGILKPFKRYQIQPVWRADKPQKGRFREFYQCDIDTVGVQSIVADAEIVATMTDVFSELGFDSIYTRINHRKILKGIIEVSGLNEEDEVHVIRAIDKLDKIGIDAVVHILSENNMPESALSTIREFLSFNGNAEEKITFATKKLSPSEIGLQGVRELEELFETLNSFGISDEAVLLDFTLARGLDYYTGPIFESSVKNLQIGSVAGGGRYDNLIGLFKGENIPAVGAAIGFERIITVMDELNMYPDNLKTPVQILVTVFNEETRSFSLKLTGQLRQAGFNTSLYLGQSKLRGQLGYADEKGIPLVIIAGPDEINEEKVTLKNMLTKEQQQIDLEKLQDAILKYI